MTSHVMRNIGLKGGNSSNTRLKLIFLFFFINTETVSLAATLYEDLHVQTILPFTAKTTHAESPQGSNHSLLEIVC